MEDRKPYEQFHNFCLGWKDKVKGISRSDRDFTIQEGQTHLLLAYTKGSAEATLAYEKAYQQAIKEGSGFSYLIGWTDGSLGVHLDDQDLAYPTPQYKEGRKAGLAARDASEHKAEIEYGYTPNMFRESMGPVPTCLR